MKRTINPYALAIDISSSALSRRSTMIKFSILSKNKKKKNLASPLHVIYEKLFNLGRNM